MSEGKWHGWAWGQYKEDNNKSIEFFPAPTFVPPNEPHPDKLKRCEICNHCGLSQHDLITDKRVYRCRLLKDNCPDSHTCDEWQWDEHGKDTDE